MKILGIIDFRYDSPHTQRPWHEFSCIQSYVSSKLEKMCNQVLRLGEKGDLEASKTTSITELYQIIERKSKNFDLIVYTYGDEPFLDLDLCQKMIQNHTRYFADFSFSEGYPQGLTPLIFNQKILADLIELAEDQQPSTRNFFFDTMKKDLNRFAIETEISPVDLRSQRVKLNYENKTQAHICENFVEHKATDATSILKITQEHPEILWGYPSYYTLQIMNNCPQKCGYCPYAQSDNYGNNQVMSLDQLKALLKQIHALSEEATVSLSYMGEPCLHPDFGLMMQEVLEFEGLNLHIETSGVGWKDTDWHILTHLDKNRTSLIISLDTHDAVTYEKIRGQGFEEAMNFTQRALEEFPQNTWIQSVRQKSLEHQLEEFYRTMKDKGAQVIIQKYNNYCGLLPDEKSVNIAPLERNVCWALKTEMSILSDGTIPLCQSDAKVAINLGNAFQTPLCEIWQNMNHYRLEHTKKKYPKICSKCDEYYIFNF